MTEIVAIVARTGVVEQGGVRTRITKEAIESIPEQIGGDWAIPVVPDHDPFCLPIGKIREAWVEPHGDEYAVIARMHIEDDPSIEVHIRSGAELVHLNFEDCPKPFIQRRYGHTELPTVTLSVDLANFDDLEDYSEFANDVSLIDNRIICDSAIGRHSLVPEPLIKFVLSDPEMCAALAIGVWALRRAEKFVRYTVDETLRKVADGISDSLSIKIRDILRAYRSHQSEQSSSSVTQIVIPGNTELILLVKTDLDEEFPTLDLKKLTAEMEMYGDLLQEASSATFARVGVNDWKLQYLTTRTGKVVATLNCHERTKKLMRDMERDQCSIDFSSGD